MAEKKDKKSIDVGGLEIGVLIGLIVLIAAWPSIYAYLQTAFEALGGPPAATKVTTFVSTYGPFVSTFFKKAVDVVIFVAFPVSLFFLIGIIYSVEQLKHIRNKEEEKYDLKVEPAYEPGIKASRVLAERWDRVIKNVSSENSNDWRQAILEADIMLEDVLTTLGYQGEGIGEKLKRVEAGDMESLQQAWEAHKVRNQVAHDGASFPLTKYEAQRVINLYKKVFEEFYYI